MQSASLLSLATAVPPQVVEQHEAKARAREASAAEARRARRSELEQLTAAAARLRRDFEVRGAGIE